MLVRYFIYSAASLVWMIGAAPAQTSGLSSGGGAASFLSRQTSDQMRATTFMNRTVHGTDGNAVGTIKDLVFDRDGSLAAVVVAVSGAAGAGEKTIGVPFKTIQMTRASNNEERIVLHVTRDDLRSAPNFVASDDTVGTSATGAGEDGGAPARAPQGASPLR